MTRVFLDTNIVLDYLLSRYPEAAAVEEIYDQCIRGEIECYISPHSLSNIFYILRKDYSIAERKLALSSLCEICQVQEIDERIVKDALEDPRFDDFEDALQMRCAEACNADVFITRDMNDFRDSKIPVQSKL